MTSSTLRQTGFIFAALMVASSANAADGSTTNPIRPAELLKHIEVLSSDAFEGRGVGSPGETKTVVSLPRS